MAASMAAMDVLAIDDLAPVLEETYEARAKWHNLGVALRLPEHELESIESQCSAPEDGLREMLKTWLRRVEPQPTRAALVKALTSKLVGEELLAKELEEKYCRDQAPLSKSMFDQQKWEGGREGERGGGRFAPPPPPPPIISCFMVHTKVCTEDSLTRVYLYNYSNKWQHRDAWH